MATEIAFAKAFLAQLDSKPTKLAPDHVEDARGYPPTTPYTLPRLPSQPCLPPRKKSIPTGTENKKGGGTTTKKVVVKSARNPPLSISLGELDIKSTSVLDVKMKVAEEADVPVDKVKVLWNKKLVGDTKVIGDVVGEDEGEEVEFGVMILGGAGVLGTGGFGSRGKKGDGEGEGRGEKGGEGDGGKNVVAQGLAGEKVLDTEAFWEDLNGFLQQRVRDAGVAERVTGVFRGAWEGR
ncbi:cell-cycle control medial ring component [Echria macrotheca]|uniref:Cell-cycle control medial ring component n=1 Tax=Echria macrotheca TaxID=438768 RepID=A0AAJ0BMS5_9PEZI|nr:cell-cycle control medial ring component [Echria macrotheca]